MKKQLMFLVALFFAGSVFAAVPTVTDVSCVQDDGRRLNVSYTLSGGPAYVTLDVQTNGVSVGGKALGIVTGEVNAKLESGTHRFVWNVRKAGLEKRDFGPDEVKVVLKAHALGDAPDYMVVDLTNGKLGYYETAALLPNGPLLENGTTDELLADPYRTTKIVFRKIPAMGVPFQVGASGETYAYRALLSYDYYLTVYEITQRQLSTWHGTTSSTYTSAPDSPVRPVDHINGYSDVRGGDWPSGLHDNVASGTPVAKLRTLTGGVKFDLPTLAEWEFAACRETTTDWYFGKTNDVMKLDDYAWYTNNAEMTTHPVGLKKPNMFGLYDMYGNVNEWLIDKNDYKNGIGSTIPPTRLIVDPVGPASASSHYKIGGSYRQMAEFCSGRAASGGNWDNGMSYSGFRLCLPIEQSAAAVSDGETVSQDALSGIVTVRYHLDEDVVVTLDVLTNGVSIGQANVTHAWGDVNCLVAAGDRELKWAAAKSWPGHGELDNVTFKVVKWPRASPPDYLVTGVGENTGHAWLYYTCAEQIPFGLTNALYKSELFVMKRVRAAGHTWVMGSPESELNRSADWEMPHRVVLSKDYYLGVYEVTQRQYQRSQGLADSAVPSWERKYGATPDWELLPMNSNSQWKASTALRGTTMWPSAVVANSPIGKWGTRTGLALDLPTEAQWEYAARAGEYATWVCGNSDGDLGDYAWYSKNAEGRLHEVGLKLPNAWGFYDMSGNANEYCLQYLWKGGNSYGLSDDAMAGVAVDPIGATSDLSNITRVNRGGSFDATSKDCRLASRGTGNDGSRTTGFRLCAPVNVP